MDGVESREFVLRVESASWTVERERESGEGRKAGKVCNGRPSKRKEVKKEKGSLFKWWGL